MNLDHLEPAIRSVMTESDEARIRFARSEAWIPYSAAQEVLKAMEDLLEHPPIGRMPNLIVVGRAGNGKSTIVRQFKERHPPTGTDDDIPCVPVVVVEMPPEPSVSWFYTAALKASFVAHRASDSVTSKEDQLISVLIGLGVRMIILDEFHNILHGSPKAQRKLLTAIKTFCNKLKVPIAAFGTRDAISALALEPQMSSRFEPRPLPLWSLNREYLCLLKSFEEKLPLKQPSALTEREFAMRLHALSEGTIGAITRLLVRCTVHAIKTGKESIDLALLNSIDWVKPSQYADVLREV